MATYKEAIYKLLQDDAKLGDVGHLGNLLGKTGTAPYGVHFINPPASPDFPLITYQEISVSGKMPRVGWLNITAWGDQYEEIHEIIYDLLHEAIVGQTTGMQVVQIQWNWSGPEVFDQNFQIYAQTQRYAIIGVKI